MARRLQIKNEKSVQRYIEHCEKRFLQHKFVDRLVSIQKNMKTKNLVEITQELGKLEKIRKTIVLRAERKCRKGGVPFAPIDVQRYGREIRLWSMIIARKTGKKVSPCLIERHACSISIKNYMSHSVEAMKKLQATAWQEYRKAKPTAKQRRHEFLKQKAEMYEEDRHNNLAKKI